MSNGAASTTAVIAAAGSGERLGAGGPKALVPLAGRPMVAWSAAAFCEAEVATIVAAAPPKRERELEHASILPLRAVTGGATRSQSVRNALDVVETDLVAIHDAARPLVTAALVLGVIETLESDPGAAGAIAACPVTDTIKRAAEPGHSVEATVDRAGLWAAQTPQVFRTEALREALAGDRKAVEAATDDAMLVEAAGGRVLIHPAPPENFKVTTPIDLRVAEQLLG